MKRVLIITYYWPPSGGAGVQRWLKFSKYLPEHGWQPVIYTPSNPGPVVQDPALLQDVPQEAEVTKQPIREPYIIYHRFTGRGKGDKVHTGFLSNQERTGWREAVALWVRSNFFIPDARAGWVKPSIKFLVEYLRSSPVDAMVSTGPPHSMHLIALAVKRRLGTHWIADFRDPWTNIDFYDQLELTRWADRKHHRLQREVLSEADQVIAVSRTMAQELQELSARQVKMIMNGHDLPRSAHVPEVKPFTLMHVGSLTSTRNATGLWMALSRLIQEDNEFADRFQLELIGPVDHSAKESMREAGLQEHVGASGELSHEEAIARMRTADVLLLLINDTPNAKGILTSKFFEYLACGRPILVIGPTDGDVARILQEPHLILDRGTEMDERNNIKALFDRGAISHIPPEEHSRRQRCKQLVEECLQPLLSR